MHMHTCHDTRLSMYLWLHIFLFGSHASTIHMCLYIFAFIAWHTMPCPCIGRLVFPFYAPLHIWTAAWPHPAYAPHASHTEYCMVAQNFQGLQLRRLQKEDGHDPCPPSRKVPAIWQQPRQTAVERARKAWPWKLKLLKSSRVVRRISTLLGHKYELDIFFAFSLWRIP